MGPLLPAALALIGGLSSELLRGPVGSEARRQELWNAWIADALWQPIHLPAHENQGERHHQGQHPLLQVWADQQMEQGGYPPRIVHWPYVQHGDLYALPSVSSGAGASIGVTPEVASQRIAAYDLAYLYGANQVGLQVQAAFHEGKVMELIARLFKPDLLSDEDLAREVAAFLAYRRDHGQSAFTCDPKEGAILRDLQTMGFVDGVRDGVSLLRPELEAYERDFLRRARTFFQSPPYPYSDGIEEKLALLGEQAINDRILHPGPYRKFGPAARARLAEETRRVSRAERALLYQFLVPLYRDQALLPPDAWTVLLQCVRVPSFAWKELQTSQEGP